MGWLSKLFGSDKLSPTSVRTFEQLETLLDLGRPMIVDVWSETCAPCKRLVPVMADLATAYDGQVSVVEINTTAERDLLQELNVRATPTIIVFNRHGEEIGRVTGYRSKQWFDEMIAKELHRDEGDAASA